MYIITMSGGWVSGLVKKVVRLGFLDMSTISYLQKVEKRSK